MLLFERAVLALYSLLVGALSLSFLLTSAGWTVLLDLYEYTLTRTDYRVIGAIIAAGMFLVSWRFFWSSLKVPRKKVDQVIIHRAEEGEVTISSTALEQLVIRGARQVKGLREVKPYLKLLPEGVSISLEVTASPDQNLPALAQELQNNVRRYVTSTAGLEILEVRISVNGIAYETVRRVD
ncbi:MAG: alkaline shock response membrane anchor protein AmaP [Thermanaeromonas sp.]|uniref:alkaline shock response membrane anchor protein AmaP n=1 Tax=Thermanaeromonas sp. TaxID=2003697 RepID=UPI002440EBDD|nr:alkaline shock response membrane anchor protein AmaP [Thermanaeromonas sp.]MCG0277617.1 alkaline shock response membrane anchor protein AmaP [Thermanaeromonas sp.]